MQLITTYRRVNPSTESTVGSSYVSHGTKWYWFNYDTEYTRGLRVNSLNISLFHSRIKDGVLAPTKRNQ